MDMLEVSSSDLNEMPWNHGNVLIHEDLGQIMLWILLISSFWCVRHDELEAPCGLRD